MHSTTYSAIHTNMTKLSLSASDAFVLRMAKMTIPATA